MWTSLCVSKGSHKVKTENCEYIVDQMRKTTLFIGIGTELGLVNNKYNWLNFKSLGGLYYDLKRKCA